jgi:hypothetical protein
MKFSKFADLVLLSAKGIKDARACRAQPQAQGVTAWHRAVHARIRWLRKWLLRQPAGTVFMLLAVTCIGRGACGEECDVLDVYCRISDTASTPQGAIEQLLSQVSLFDYLWRGLKVVEDYGIDLDRWMGT